MSVQMIVFTPPFIVYKIASSTKITAATQNGICNGSSTKLYSTNTTRKVLTVAPNNLEIMKNEAPVL